MDGRLDHDLMGHALDEARLALAGACFPVGAVLAIGDRVIGRARKSWARLISTMPR